MARQSPEHLRVALLVYRGNPHSGGQGVYTRYLARELVALGHQVTVFAGQPWPELDAGVGWVPVSSLDLYREPDPFRVPRLREFRSWIDGLEFALMCTAGFPEPLTFSLRVRQELAARRGEFDLVHDNQCFGWGMLGVLKDGWPLLATLHHPITVDRALDLSHAATWGRRLSLRRWYGFLGMQMRVARRVPGSSPSRSPPSATSPPRWESPRRSWPWCPSGWITPGSGPCRGRPGGRGGS